MEKGWVVFTWIASVMTLVGFAIMGFVVFGETPSSESQKIVDSLPLVQTVSAAPKDEKVEKDKPEGTVVDVSDLKDKINILILGVDTRGEELEGRTDAMIVLSLDKENQTTKMLSIPRDSYVEIVGKGIQDKITHAYAFGGLEMATDTVEEMLDIEIDHHLVLNFSSFTSAIDTLGGIDVEVPFSFSEQNAKGEPNALHFEEGLQTLNGEEALAFARMRKQDPKGDIGRGERQQQVISAVFDKLLTIGSVTKYGKLYNEISGSVDTDVNVLDIPKLAPYLDTLGEIESLTINGGGIKLSGVYYYQLDETSLYDVRESFKE